MAWTIFLIKHFGIDVGAMDGRMASGAPACPGLKKKGMVHFPDKGPARLQIRSGHLGMTPQTKIAVPLAQELVIDGTMRVMTGGTSLPKRLVLVNKRTRLFPVALATELVFRGHAKRRGGLKDHGSVRIMTVDTSNPPFHHRMAVRKTKARSNSQVALDAYAGIISRIGNPPGAIPAALNVPTSGSVTRFAPSESGIRGGWLVKSPVSAVRKALDDIGMAISTGLVSDKFRPFNAWRPNGRVFKAGGTAVPPARRQDRQSRHRRPP